MYLIFFENRHTNLTCIYLTPQSIISRGGVVFELKESSKTIISPLPHYNS